MKTLHDVYAQGDAERIRDESQFSNDPSLEKDPSADFSVRVSGYLVESFDGRIFIDKEPVKEGFSLADVFRSIQNSPRRSP